jgi:hypothetical protein
MNKELRNFLAVSTETAPGVLRQNHNAGSEEMQRLLGSEQQRPFCYMGTQVKYQCLQLPVFLLPEASAGFLICG